MCNEKANLIERVPGGVGSETRSGKSRLGADGRRGNREMS